MPAPIIPPVDPAKVAALIATTQPRCVEIASVGWFGATQWIHYSDAWWDRHFPALANYNLTGIQARFSSNSWFAEFTRTSDLADDKMTLIFDDKDWNITSLWWGYGGEGVPVIITQYFPDVDLLVEIFDGYLRTPKSADGFSFPVECATGFRSPNLTLPRRIIYTGCSALFGGLINPTTNQPWFPTQAAINENDCPYNKHIGGSTGNLDPSTGQPFKDCPRQRPSDCTQRLGDSKNYLGFDVIVGGEVTGTSWNPYVANIRANETALKTPLRVIYGQQRIQDLTLLAYASGSNDVKRPENGFLTCLFVIAEGPNVGCGPALSDPESAQQTGNPGPSTPGLDSSIRINEAPMYCDHVNWSGVFGLKGPLQGKALVGQAGLASQQLVYANTSVVNLDYGRQDFRNFTPDSINASCKMVGKKDIRVYSNPTTYQRHYTTNRAWCLFDLLTNKRYGMGIDYSRFIIQEWIDLANWCDEIVSGYNDTGSPVTMTRSTFNGVVDGRSAQNVIGDFCMMGRFTPPFQDQGKLRVLPLRENAVPTNPATWNGVVIADFDNDMDTRYQQNIIWEKNVSSLTYSIQSDADISNELKFTFNDQVYDDTERPIQVQDLNAQLLAGRAAGDLSFRVVSKSLAGFGINNLPEAARMATMLLYYGENEAGGLKNNFSIKFKTWSVLAKLFGLHPYQIIRVLSQRVNRFTERGTLEWSPYAADAFQWFRITKLKRTSKLIYEVDAQLYATSSLQQFKSIQAAAGADNPAGQTTVNPGPTPKTESTDKPLPSAESGASIQMKVS
jgi:hypothetical protein